MLFVINTKRPFTSNPDEILHMKEMLEFSSKLKITEFVCNTNLMAETTESLMIEGIEIIKEAAARSDIAFRRYLVLNKYEESVHDGLMGLSREVMNYTLRKPWEK